MFNTFLRVIANYLIVQTCIVLFILPFYWLYSRNYAQSREVKVSFSRHLEYFFASKYANWLVFSWAMGEALIWFVIPEFLLILLIFMRIQRKRELLFYDIYGTIAGTLVAFAVRLPERFIDRLPYIQPSMITQVRQWYDAHGIFGLVYQPFSGVPYKIFTHLAPEYHYFVLTFLVFAVVVRISRYYLIYLMLSGVYPILHKYVYRNYIRLFLISTFVFSVLLLRVYTSYGHLNLSVKTSSSTGQSKQTVPTNK